MNKVLSLTTKNPPSNIQSRSSNLHGVSWIIPSENSIIYIGLEDGLHPRIPIPIVTKETIANQDLFYIARINDTFGIAWWNGDGDEATLLRYRWRFSDAGDTIGKVYFDTSWNQGFISDRPQITLADNLPFGLSGVYFGTGKDLCDTGVTRPDWMYFRSTGFVRNPSVARIARKDHTRNPISSSQVHFRITGQRFPKRIDSSVDPKYSNSGHGK